MTSQDDEKQSALVARGPSFELVPAGNAAEVRQPQTTIRVLIIDNDQSHAETIAEGLRSASELYECTLAFSGKGGAQLIEQEPFDLIFTDLVMNDVDGLDILEKAKMEQPEAEVFLVTGHGDIPSAVAAMSQGAFWYLQKPLDLKQLRTVAARAVENIQLRRANIDLQRRLDEKFGFEGVIGASPAMHHLIEQLRRVATTNATVLILGENGSGKEPVAQAIHQNSRRKNKRFVDLNCAALSSQILESELFGHVKGAFTDATSDRIGKFEYAHGGTLFLDELGDMPLSIQVKLLRVLETKEIVRVGSNEPIKVDVRIIAATNKNLEEAVANGDFREDLYYRLNVVTVRVPPLRERVEDIPLLADVFIRRFAQEHGKPIRGASMLLRRRLMLYQWPGNIRQLRNKIEEMVIFDTDGFLDLDDLPPELQEVNVPLPAPGENGENHLVGKSLSEIEKYYIQETLKITGGNREDAARILGIAERTLYRRIKEYKI
ncbi:Acetoacetate metabolism regulatory protein AtoC [Planctomycetales bacterium 10988]|nr:Acetoacetate metabolism regulatory protein AtoC [Planctomycetales bacterium 10988]